MGTLLGYDLTGEQMYSFPWSHGHVPYLIKPYGSHEMPLGFEIPTNIVNATYEASDFEIIQAERRK